MTVLHGLKNTSRPTKKVQRIGRGPGSRRGKTACRGSKGDGSRSGYRRRFGYEGGQVPLYRKLPVRGFTRGRFPKAILAAINLAMIDKLFSDGEVVNYATLREKGLLPKGKFGGFKILSYGEIKKKKITIEANSYSEEAIQKLKKSSISYKIVE